MKHIRKMNENTGGEYLMILHTESGDEIHIDLIEMSHYANIRRMLDDTSSGGDYNELIEYIYDNKVSQDMMCQTYVLEDYLFSGYNIVKAINIAELGA